MSIKFRPNRYASYDILLKPPQCHNIHSIAMICYEWSYNSRKNTDVFIESFFFLLVYRDSFSFLYRYSFLVPLQIFPFVLIYKYSFSLIYRCSLLALQLLGLLFLSSAGTSLMSSIGSRLQILPFLFDYRDSFSLIYCDTLLGLLGVGYHIVGPALLLLF